MQSVGLQTVLQMSNAMERVQQTAQAHGAVNAEQFKDELEKENDLKKTEVHQTEKSENPAIREEEERRRQQQEKRDARGEADKEKEKEDETRKARSGLPVDDVPQGRLLNIRV